MEQSKYDAYKKFFYKGRKPEYKGRILINNLSPRIVRNTKVSNLLVKLEEIIQNWFDSASYIKKKINYRVGKEDNDTIYY